MSETLRRGGWSAVIVGAQAIAFAALAQQPSEQPRPRHETSDRPTSAETGRMSSPTQREAMEAVTPQQFATQAATIGKAEIELGQLALQRSQDEEVRKYAQRIVADHKAADAKLRKIAAQERLTLPQTLDAEHQAVKQRLSGLQGAAFDREYKKEMAKGHDKAVALFESASQAQQLPEDLKEFAASTLPTLQEHQEHARSLHEKGGA